MMFTTIVGIKTAVPLVLILMLFILMNEHGQTPRYLVAGSKKRRPIRKSDFSIRMTPKVRRRNKIKEIIMRTIKSLKEHLSSSRLRKIRVGRALRRFMWVPILCLVLGATAFDAHGAQAKPAKKTHVTAAAPKRYFVELTAANFKQEIGTPGTLPSLLESCVPAVCKLEEPDLNAVAQSLTGKVRVLRVNMAQQPKIFAGLLVALAGKSGNPFLPLILSETPARWVMHTVLDPDASPVISAPGLITGGMMLQLVATQLATKDETDPGSDAGSKQLDPERIHGNI